MENKIKMTKLTILALMFLINMVLAQKECNVTLKSKVFTYSTTRNRPIRIKMTQKNPEEECLLTLILPKSNHVILNVSKNVNYKLENKTYNIVLKRISKDKLWLDIGNNNDFENRYGKFDISGNIAFGFPTPHQPNVKTEKLTTPVSNVQCFPGMLIGTANIDGPFNLCLEYHNYMQHDIDSYLRYDRNLVKTVNLSYVDENLNFQYKFNDTSNTDCQFKVKCYLTGSDGEKEYQISIRTKCPVDIRLSSRTIWLPIVFAIVFSIVFVIVFGIIVMYAYQQRKMRTHSENLVRKYELGNLNLPEWTKELNMPRGYIILEEKLGEGAFGVVYKGIVQNISLTAFDGNHYVAVKTAIPGGYNELLKEGEVLSKLDFHYNIINFLAVSTGTIEENSQLMLIFEYCAKGCLHDLLEEKKETKNIEAKQMLAWTYQIAMGMEFLYDNRIIHGDLSTRNILLDTDLNIKIGDFGKAHRINYASIEVPIKGAQPMLWMAPEALQNHAVTLNSDKWSYGVTVWEIFSFGIDPYPDRVDYRGLLSELSNGHRMKIPEKCPSRIYSEVIYPSWKPIPEERPQWTDLIKLLESLVDSEYLKRYQILQKRKKNYYHAFTTSISSGEKGNIEKKD